MLVPTCIDRAMVMPFHLGVTVLVVFATAVANAGILQTCMCKFTHGKKC